MKHQVNIIRIDPDRRTIVAMRMRCGRNAVHEVRRILRAKTVGHYEFTHVAVNGAEGEPVPLMVAGGLDVEQDQRGWRLMGGEDTGGIGILFGKGKGGGMVDVPVSVSWVEKMIIWLDGEQVDEAA